MRSRAAPRTILAPISGARERVCAHVWVWVWVRPRGACHARAHASARPHARCPGVASRFRVPVHAPARAHTLSHARAHARGRRHGHGHVARVHKYADVNAKCWPHARQTHNHPSAKQATLSSHTATPATTHHSVPRTWNCVGRWVCGTPYPSNPQVAIDFLGSDGHGARGAGQHLARRRRPDSRASTRDLRTADT